MTSSKRESWWPVIAAVLVVTIVICLIVKYDRIHAYNSVVTAIDAGRYDKAFAILDERVYTDPDRVPESRAALRAVNHAKASVSFMAYLRERDGLPSWARSWLEQASGKDSP